MDRAHRGPTRRAVLEAALGACVTAWLGCHSRDKEVTFAAAASLRQVLPKLIEAFEEKLPGRHIVATYGASGDLAKQVEGGAPIDAVIFAGAKPVDDLIGKSRVEASSKKTIATNQLVLVAPKPRDGEPALAPLTFDTLGSIGPKDKVAIGDPGAVPAGQYAKEELVALGQWEALADRLVLAGDVSAVLAYAKRGEVRAAIVYETEARGIDGIVVLDRAHGPSAPHPLVIGGIVTGAAGRERAQALLDFTTSDDGRRIFADFGFGPP